MAKSVAGQVASRMMKISREVGQADKTAISRAALGAKKTIEAEIRSVVPSMRLSGVGRSGARVGVRYDVKFTPEATATVRATGPLHLVENPTQPHEIRPRRRGRKRALLTPAGPRAVVRHPGTTPSLRPWRTGRAKATPVVQRTVERAYQDAFTRGVS